MTAMRFLSTFLSVLSSDSSEYLNPSKYFSKCEDFEKILVLTLREILRRIQYSEESEQELTKSAEFFPPNVFGRDSS